MVRMYMSPLSLPLYLSTSFYPSLSLSLIMSSEYPIASPTPVVYDAVAEEEDAMVDVDLAAMENSAPPRENRYVAYLQKRLDEVKPANDEEAIRWASDAIIEKNIHERHVKAIRRHNSRAWVATFGVGFVFAMMVIVTLLVVGGIHQWKSEHRDPYTATNSVHTGNHQLQSEHRDAAIEVIKKQLLVDHIFWQDYTDDIIAGNYILTLNPRPLSSSSTGEGDPILVWHNPLIVTPIPSSSSSSGEGGGV